MPSFALPHMPTWPISKPRSARNSAKHSPATSIDLRSIPENFGVPDIEDPDPFGVLALERAGLEIKEAGTHSRPSSDTFEFRPSPSSPVFRQSFQSIDAVSKRASKRESRRSAVSVDQGTQTADLTSPSEEKWEDGSVWSGPVARRGSATPSTFGPERRIEAWSASIDDHHEDHDFVGIRGEQGHEVASPRSSLARTSRSLIPEHPITEEPEPVASLSPISQRSTPSTPRSSGSEADVCDFVLPEDDDLDYEEPIVAQVVQATPVVQAVQSAQVIQPTPTMKVVAQSVTSPRAKLVTIKGRPAPALPARNPLRQRCVRTANETDHLDVNSVDGSFSSLSPSPTRSAFDHTDEASNPWSEQTSIPEGRSAVSSKRNSFDHLSEKADDIDQDTSCGHDAPDRVLKPFEKGLEQSEPENDRSKSATSLEVPSTGAVAVAPADITPTNTVKLTPSVPEPTELSEPLKLSGSPERPHRGSITEKVDNDAQVSGGRAEEVVTETFLPINIMSASLGPETLLPSRSVTRETPGEERTPKLDTGSFDESSKDDSPAESLTPRSIEDMVSKQKSLIALTQETSRSDAASISDYGEDEPHQTELHEDNDDTRGSETFHSMPSTPYESDLTNPIDVPQVPALPTAVLGM